MAELQMLAATDPEAQNQLLEELRQCDPAIWPLALRQFRATAAYRQRRLAQGNVASGQSAQRLPPITTPVLGNETSLPINNQAETAAANNDSTVIANGPSPQTYGTNPSGEQANCVIPAGYSTGIAEPASGANTNPSGLHIASDDWKSQLQAAIAALESKVVEHPVTAEELADHARLRVLYAAADRAAEAARPIPAAEPAINRSLAGELEALSAWLDPQQAADPAAAAARAKAALATSVASLGEAAPLLVRNLAFCTEVQSFGCAKRFEKYEFQPNQEVLVYAEVENFVSESTPKGYHTALRSSYEILDAQNRRVAEQAFTPTEEYCQNHRRDFFIGYHLRLPKQIAPGKYTLRLSIEDLKCNKIGQGSIEFSVN